MAASVAFPIWAALSDITQNNNILLLGASTVRKAPQEALYLNEILLCEYSAALWLCRFAFKKQRASHYFFGLFSSPHTQS